LIPECLDEAAAIYQREDGASTIVLSTECDAAGKPIVICVRPSVRSGVRFVNMIMTAFGKDNADSWAAQQVSNLLYIGEKANPRLTLPTPIYHPAGALETEGSKRIIRGPDDLRKFKLNLLTSVG